METDFTSRNTRQIDFTNEVIANYQPRYEERTIQSVSTDKLQVSLTEPVVYDHRGARDGAGQLDFLPHVANLSRNVLLMSENSNGSRGHTLFAHRADIDVRYAEFRSLGRTTVDPIDNTTLNEAGEVTHIGTNQIARYPIHTHHLSGPINPNNQGYQFQLIGNAITRRES